MSEPVNFVPGPKEAAVRIREAAQIIMTSFTWATTPQPAGYWSLVHLHLEELALLAEKQAPEKTTTEKSLEDILKAHLDKAPSPERAALDEALEQANKI